MLRGIAVVLSFVAFITSASAAELKVFCSVAMSHTVEKLAPGFNKATGHTVVLVLGPSGGVAKRVADGEAGDLLITARPNLDPLLKNGKLAGERTDIAQSSVGIAVKAGAPKPDISTADALKAALLATKSIVFSNPATGGASGVHFGKVIDQLGISKEVMAKAKLLTGELAATYVASGEIEMAAHQIPELKIVQGVEIIGPLPPPFQAIIQLSGAVIATSAHAEAARALIAHLTSPEAKALVTELGMTPGGGGS